MRNPWLFLTKMKKVDFKKKLYKYWDASPDYYDIAEDVHADLEAKRKELFTIIKKGGKVLDIACGSGVNRKDINEGVFYCGIDLSSVGLSAAKRANMNASFVKADAENLPVMSNSFDYIISTNAVEHFIEPRAIFDEMWRVCKKGGYILLAFPNHGDYIFNYPPSLSYMMNLLSYRVTYVLKQFYRQTIRIFSKRIFFFAKIDVVPEVLINTYLPDTDITYLASGREVRNYFDLLGASDISVESRNHLYFAKPFPINILRNIYRIYKAVNPYYSWHGDTVLVIRK